MTFRLGTEKPLTFFLHCMHGSIQSREIVPLNPQRVYSSLLSRFNKPEEEVEIERSTSSVRLLPPPTPAPYPFHDPFPIHKGQFAGGSVSPYRFQFSEELSPTPSPLALQLLGKVFKRCFAN